MSSPPSSSTVPLSPLPQFIGTEISNIYSVLSMPAVMTGLFRDFLARHFASTETIESPDLKRLIWHDSPRTSIQIEPIATWDPKKTAKRPAVIIKRQAFTNRRVGLGGERRQLPAVDREGHPHYTTFWLGSHTLFCISALPIQCESLATEVYRELHHFGRFLMQEGHLMRFGVVEIGAMAELEEWEEHFVVPVNVAYAYEDSWVVRQQAPLLKRIALSSLLQV